MKKLFILFLTSVTFCGMAQDTEGVVTYESVIKIDVSRFPPEMKSMIPPERKSQNQLLFNDKEAIYKRIKEEEDINKEVSTGGGARVQLRMRGQGGDNEFYSNLESGESIDKTEFFGRTFLVEGGEKIEWKVTGEMEMIAGYQCMKATYMRDTIPVVAWFTPQIPVSVGPAQYKGLPGLVLAVDINDGQRSIKATNVEMRALASEEIIAMPEKGKKVTREEFNKIRDEKIEEMRETNGGNGRSFIIRN